MREASLLQRFSFLSLAVMLLMGFAFGKIVTYSLERNMLKRHEQLTAEIISEEIIMEFTAAELVRPKTGTDYELFEKKIRHISLGPNIERIKIWNTEKAVVWADDRRIVGQVFEDNEDLLEALDGELVSELSTLKKEEHGLEVHLGRALELYIPVRFGSQEEVIAVFEVYKNLDPLYADIAKQKKLVWLAVTFAFLFLYSVLSGIVWSASKKIKSQTEDIRRSEERHRILLKAARDSIVTMGEDGLITDFNEAAERMFGYSAGEVLGKKVEILIPERYRARHHEAVERFRSTRTSSIGGMSREYEALRKDGTEFPVSITISPVEIEGSLLFLAIIRDITERREAELSLKKLSTAIEQSVSIVFITDVSGNIEYVNQAFEDITGYSKQDVIGKNPRVLSSGDTPDWQYKQLWETVLAGRTWRGEYKNKKKNGDFYWCNTVISPIEDAAGEITNFLAVQEDVTERKYSEERIEYLANYDELTGLLNRTRFAEMVKEGVSRAKDSHMTGGLFLLDIDQFKFLNDTYGHRTGDEFLKGLSKVITETVERIYVECMPEVEDKPVVGRLASDEFAVLFPCVGEDECVEVADRLRSAVDGVHFADVESSLTVSIGIVLFPQHGTDTGSLLTRADAAMNRAKELGRNRCHLYRPEDKDLEKMHSRLRQKEMVLKALDDGRFEPWFQPILDLKSNKIYHYEALARMRDKDGGILFPDAFVSIAEEFGLIGSIDRMIIEKVMRFQVDMKRRGTDVCFSMNLSGKDLGDKELLSFIQEKIEETGADPARLVFEITETAAVSDIGIAAKFVGALKRLGCHFSLDDFGVGFTSFMYLKELQVDYIKIDGSFIRRLHENRDDQIVVKAMTDVAKGFKIKSIAEFVEKEETLKLLGKLGVDYAQGYLIGRPAPALVEKKV